MHAACTCTLLGLHMPQLLPRLHRPQLRLARQRFVRGYHNTESLGDEEGVNDTLAQLLMVWLGRQGAASLHSTCAYTLVLSWLMRKRLAAGDGDAGQPDWAHAGVSARERSCTPRSASGAALAPHQLTPTCRLHANVAHTPPPNPGSRAEPPRACVWPAGRMADISMSAGATCHGPGSTTSLSCVGRVRVAVGCWTLDVGRT